MILKKISLGSVEVSYFDNEKKGNTLLLIHGNSLNAELFYKQYQSAELNNYRLLALDLPGHGKTGKTANPGKDYSVAGYINLVKEFILATGINDIVLFGHSLGGHIAIHVADEIKDVNIKGIAICGTPPLTVPPKLEEAFLPNPAMMLAFKSDLNSSETELLASSFCSEQIEDYEKVKESIKNTDPMVRPLIGQSIGTDLVTDESQILKDTPSKVAILHGVNDKNVNRDYIKGLGLPLWTGQIMDIEEAGHSPFIETPEVFNRLLSDFINSLGE